MSRSRSVVIRSLVILNEAAGGVKDLKHRSGVQQRFVPSRFFTVAPLDLHKGKKYGWNVYFCCIKETGQPTVK